MDLRRAIRLFLPFVLLAAGCGSPPNPQQDAAAASGPDAVELTVMQAQAAVNEWLQQPGAPGGTATVAAVHEMQNQNWITADLRMKDFITEEGHIDPDQAPGQAVFFRGGSGVWMLTRVVWDGGHMTATPEVSVP